MPNQAERPPARAGGFARGCPLARVAAACKSGSCAPRSTQHIPSARHVSGAGYTPFISRAPAALLIAANCVVANDATLAESGPFLCHAMRLLGLPMLSLAPRPPLGVVLATRGGAPQADRFRLSAVSSAAKTPQEPRSVGGKVGLDTLKNRSTGRFGGS
jgi:hypothetical protein